MSITHQAPTRLSVERLEMRAVPAGNVTVTSSGGLLSVIGDSADNQVVVHHTAEKDVFVIGLNGTTVNGVAGIWAGRGIPMTFLMDLGAGNDYTEVGGLLAGRIVVQGSGGSDTLVLLGAQSFGNVEVYGSGDNDAVFISGVLAQNLLGLDGGAGTDGIRVDNSVGLRGAFANDFEFLL